jgi:hypothetical protein
MQQRRRFKQTISLQDRLKAFAEEARERAGELPPSAERDDLEERARRAETAARLIAWAN